MKTKIKAFTMMELAIGMLLASITVAAGFSMYLSFVKITQKHQEEQRKVKVLQSLYFTLENDIRISDKITNTENGILLFSEKNNLVYRLGDTLLIREIKDVSTDTFLIYSDGFTFNEQDLAYSNSLLHSFSLQLSWNKKEMNFHFRKEYSPIESINQYILKENGH